MRIYTGEVCVYCGRPILVDAKSPSVGRCRKCNAPYHTRCWFASKEKCSVPGCDGKAVDIKESRLAPVGEICPFLPPEPPRREGDEPGPAACLKAQCALFDAPEGRCSLGEISYALATVRQSGRDTRRAVQHSVDRESQQSGRLLAELGRRLGSAETHLKASLERQDKMAQILVGLGELLKEVNQSIGQMASDQKTTAGGFERVAQAIEATGVGEQVRTRREARLAARAAIRDGRPGAAVNVLKRVDDKAPHDMVSNDLACAYALAGRREQAREILESLLERSPSNISARVSLASLMLPSGEAAAAEELLEAAPTPAEPLFRAELAYARACAAYSVGRAEDAVQLLNEALDEDPWHDAAAAALSDLRARRIGDPVPQPAEIAKGNGEQTGGEG